MRRVGSATFRQQSWLLQNVVLSLWGIRSPCRSELCSR